MFFFSFSAPVFSRGTQQASGACSPGQGLLFAGEPRNFALSLCFLGGPQTRRAAKPKQKPAVPPARRRLSQLAVPARRGALKRRMGERNQSQTAGEIRPLVSIRGRRGSFGVCYLSCLSWNWRKGSSVKITERTDEEATEALRAGR